MGSMPDRIPAISRLYAGPFPAIEERLIGRYFGRAGRDPEREHVLLVSSNELREHLLKRLASAPGVPSVFAGASVMTLYDFAVRLLKHRGSFPVELPPARMAAAIFSAVRETYASGGGDFAGISATPGFIAALARTLSDLEEGCVGDAELALTERTAKDRKDARKAARWAEWRRLRASVARKVRAMGGETRRRIFREAVAGFEQPGYPFRATLYGFYDFTRLQWMLVERLLSSGLLEDVYFPALFDGEGNLRPSFLYAARAWDRLRAAFEGNVEYLADVPSAGVALVRERIFSPAPPAETGPPPFAVLSAPHAEGEMRLAARRVRSWLDAFPAASVFLVARRVTPEMAADWERIAAEYGIATAGRLDVPLASVPLVRLLLRMIAVARDDFPRREVIDVLSSPYRRSAEGEDGTAARPDLWDLLSRELLIVSGTDWETRLARPPRRRPAEDGETDPDDRRAQIVLLRSEVGALRASLRPLVEARGYAAFARAVRALLIRDFRVVDDDAPEGERDRRAVEALFAILDDLEAIPDREAPWPGAREGADGFSALLSAQRLFVGERGGMRRPGAVVLGDAVVLRGVTADRAIALSVNEDAVPAQLEEDPLLPDDDREEINREIRQPDLPDALTLRRRNAAEEKLLFALSAASVREEVAFSVLRADAAGAARRPSRYLLHLLSRFAGPAVFSEEWEGASDAVIERLPRSPFAALRGEGPRSAREAALRAWCAGAEPGVAAADVPWSRVRGILAAWSARSGGEGIFPGPGIGVRLPAWHSASALEELARCPYRYFLGRIVRLDPPEEPEEALALSPAELGEIAHDVLSRLGRDAAAGKGWGDVPAAVRSEADRFARENPTGLPGLFRIRCRGVERDVARLAARERAQEIERPGWRIERVEEAFSLPATALLPALRGRIDRIDRGPAGEARVIDYKYRDPARGEIPPDWIRHGLSHQVPVYLAYAASLRPEPSAVSAAFYFLRNGFGVEEAPEWDDIRAEWAAALAGWLSLASAGAFPPLPHHRFTSAGRASPRYCDSCPFRDHCRVSPVYDGSEIDAGALGARIAREPALRPVTDHR
ncbi:MAG: ATP-dependent nuclease subunit B-like protein, partial [Deltaproteobacteria bacterium]|nr:ATP-dependent nuclease subunit B-like protein [Deltaproteobacteria bacterium]